MIVSIGGEKTRSRIRAAQRAHEGWTNSVSGCVPNTYGELTVRQELPVEVVSTGLVGRLVPTCDFEVVQLRRFRRQKVLLDRTCNIEIVIDLREFRFEFGFAQRGSHVAANLARNQSGNNADNKN